MNGTTWLMTEIMEEITKFPEIYSIIGGLQSEDIRHDEPHSLTSGPEDIHDSTIPATRPGKSHPAISGAIDNTLVPKNFIDSVPPLNADSRVCRVRVHSQLFDAMRTVGGGSVSVSKLVNAILLEFLYKNRGKIKVTDHCAEIEEWMASSNETTNKQSSI